MRLRYLRLANIPPLEDVTIEFGHESLLGRKVAIRFVVGVNGSGKTRLLQTLAKAFLCLEQRIKPPFNITLVYDMERDGNRTIYWRYQLDAPENNCFVEFADRLLDRSREDWESLREEIEKNPSELQYRGSIYTQEDLKGASMSYALPASILVYTSGATEAWEELFDSNSFNVDFDTSEFEEANERPWNWSIDKEEETGEQSINSTSSEQTVGTFVQHSHLKLVTFAVTLDQAAKDFNKMPDWESEQSWLKDRTHEISQGKATTGLRGILNEIGWLYPITVGLRIIYDLDRWKRYSGANLYKLEKLYKYATSVLPDANGQLGRWLYFDLRRLVPLEAIEQDDTSDETANKDNHTFALLLEALGEDENSGPFDIFKTLYDWHKQGLLENISLVIRKHGHEDLLLYDWLSDGEKVFLGRMSLLHLMGQYPDSLIILDEPETHFNDFWKRRIVDVIDDNLRETPSEVVISTHSSIALTDVFDTEITLLKRTTPDLKVYATTPQIQTFGALPSEIMIKIFDAPDTVGQRASEFLDIVVEVVSFPKQTEAIWRELANANGNIQSSDFRRTIYQSKDFSRLWKLVNKHHSYEGEHRLYDVLLALLNFTRNEGANLNEIRVKDALRLIINKLGSGYYNLELNRRLLYLERKDASSS